MGGQACVLYGAAEFSRDTDFVVLADRSNFSRLLSAMSDLKAESIAVPPPELKYLLKGHALHFRCRHPDVPGFRVDVMTKMRGVEDFRKLWKRRSTLVMESGMRAEVLSIPDLVQAKKTQRDKDWPMIRRLLEVHYIQNVGKADKKKVEFWLKEMRTPALLIEAAGRFPCEARALVGRRRVLSAALRGDAKKVEKILLHE